MESDQNTFPTLIKCRNHQNMPSQVEVYQQICQLQNEMSEIKTLLATLTH